MNQEKAKDITLFLFRIVVGLMFLQHGGMKIWDWFGGVPAEYGGHPAMFTLPWIAGVLEFYGGAAVLIGLFTRPVSFVLSGLMAVAYFMAHQPRGFWPIQNQGELAVLFCFIFLLLSAYGGGPWSVDARLFKKSS